jgi:outer membrane protein assembly factor BamD (BamD/ComL family)
MLPVTTHQTTRSLAAALAVLSLAPDSLGQSERAILDPAQGWQQETIVSDDQARLELDRARAFIADNQPAKARSILNEWLDNDDFEQSQYRPEALRLRGDAKYAADRDFKALFDYEEVIQTYPESTEYVTAIEREVEIANLYLAGLRKRTLWFRFGSLAHIGEILLLRAQERMPGSLLAESAAIDLADYYFDKRRLELAAEMYEIFLKSYPSSPHRMHAMQRHVYSNIARFKGPKYDGSILLESRLLIERFARDYPAEAERAGLTNALVVRLEESAAAQQLESAQWYLRVGDGPAGRLVLSRLIRDHTGTVAATKGLQILQERGWLEDESRTIEVAPIGPEPTP